MRAIQGLAGHRDASTTMRSMHLSPSTLDDARETHRRLPRRHLGFYPLRRSTRGK